MAFTLARRSFGNPFRSVSAPAPMVRRGPSPALTRTTAALEAARTKMRSLRENAGGKGGNLEAAGATIAGGAISGALKAKFPEVAGFDTRWIAGGLGVGAGLFLVKGRLGGAVLNAGAGVLACSVSDVVEDWLDGD